jgi:putative toxin-antitoxin system antitoxin component (TIGR02293 family)
MAEREHTGKSSERAKGIKRHASSKNVKRYAAGAVEGRAQKSISRSESFSPSALPGNLGRVRKVGPAGDDVDGRESPRILRDQESRPQELAASESSLRKAESSLQEILDLLGGSPALGSAINTQLDAHELLHQGLPRGALASLMEKLHLIQADEASQALGVSLRTVQRHKYAPAEPLNVQQSGRTWKFAEILAKATRVLGSQDEAEQWLRRPAIGLDQQRPIDLLTTPAGVNLVEDYLGRLEYDGYT